MKRIVTTEDLSLVPRAAIIKAANNDPTLSTAETRRLITVGLSNAISTEHATFLGLGIPVSDCQLHFVKADAAGFHHRGLTGAAENFKKNARPSSNEATLMHTFWVESILEYFKDAPRLYYEAEWLTKELFPLSENRRVDSILRCGLRGTSGIPLLLVEAGKGKLKVGCEHKDSTKLACYASGCCHKLMNELLKQKKDPSEARCYGLLIGGSTAQCLVAYPVCTGDDWYVEVAMHAHWRFDLIDDIATDASTLGCFRTCCSVESLRRLAVGADDETIQYASQDELLKFSTVGQVSNAVDLASIAGEDDTDDEDDDDDIDDLSPDGSEELELVEGDILSNQAAASSRPAQQLEEFSTPVPATPATPNEGTIESSITRTPVNPPAQIGSRKRVRIDRSAYYDRLPSEFALKRLSFFYDNVLQRHMKLMSLDTIDCPFPPVPDCDSCLIGPDARSVTETVKEKRITPEPSSRTTSSPNAVADPYERTVVMIKGCQFEQATYRKIALTCPSFFARTFSIKPLEAGKWRFEFERMIPMLCPNNTTHYQLNAYLFIPDTDRRLLIGLGFVLDTLVGLRLLHKSIGVLHCDISPNNIMYSQFDDCWKINDFDRAVQIKEAPRKCSSRGTPEFIAPEVFAKGALSEASDVYSLGRVFGFLIRPFIQPAFRRARPQAQVLAYNTFQALCTRMTVSWPSSRPCLDEAIKTILGVYTPLLPTNSQPSQVVRAAEEIVYEFDLAAAKASVPAVRTIPALASDPIPVDPENVSQSNLPVPDKPTQIAEPVLPSHLVNIEKKL